MKKIIIFILILFFCASTANSTQDKIPERIVSLAPAITEALYLLDAQENLVGCTVYCQRPSQAKEKTKVGTAIKANIEKIINLKPDLILATTLVNIEAEEKLKTLGIKVVRFTPAKNFNELCDQFLIIGKIVGKEHQAIKIVKQAKDKVTSIKKRVKGFRQQKVFIQIGARPLYAAGKNSFLNDFIELAGGVNIAYEAGRGLYSREKVLANDPDVIIIVTMGIVGQQEKTTWEKYAFLKAAKENRIFIVDSYKFCSPTPVSFIEGLDEVVNILHFKNKS